MGSENDFVDMLHKETSELLMNSLMQKSDDIEKLKIQLVTTQTYVDRLEISYQLLWKAAESELDKKDAEIARLNNIINKLKEKGNGRLGS